MDADNAPLVRLAHGGVFVFAGVAPDPTKLTEAERAVLVVREGKRRDEWIRGRIAMRRALAAVLGPGGDRLSVLVDHDGAPRIDGGSPCAISLSHDGDRIAVAVIAKPAWRVGVDLCLRSHAGRAGRILGRLAVRAAVIDPCVQWAALEATLKLRRLSVMALREHAIEVRDLGTHLAVDGLGGGAMIQLVQRPDFVVAWTAEGP